MPKLKVLLFCFIFALAKIAGAVNLEKLDMVPLSADKLQMVLSFSQSPKKADIFVLENPFRIVIDLINVRNLTPKYHPIEFDKNIHLIIMQAKGKTRIVVYAKKNLPCSQRVSGNKIFITLGSDSEQAKNIVEKRILSKDKGSPDQAQNASTMVDLSSPPPLAVSKISHQVAAVKHVDFKKISHKEANIIVRINKKQVKMAINESKGKIKVKFLNRYLRT